MGKVTKTERSVRALRRYIDRLICDSEETYRHWLHIHDAGRAALQEHND